MPLRYPYKYALNISMSADLNINAYLPMPRPRITKEDEETPRIQSAANEQMRPSATTADLIASSPMNQEFQSKALENIRQWQDAIKKEKETLKNDLLKKLQEAAVLYKELVELGEKNLLGDDPRYAEVISILPILVESTAEEAAQFHRVIAEVKQRRGRGKGGMGNAEAILEALAGGKQMGIPSISRRASEVKGKQIPKPSVSLTLMKLKKEGKIKSPERGMYVKA